HGGHHECLFCGSGEFLKQIFHLDVRHHFAADLAEAAQPVGEAEKTLFVHPRDVARVVPAVAKNVRGFFRLVEITAHDVRAAHKQQAWFVRGDWLHGVWVHDFHCDSGQGMANAAPLGAHLTERSGAKIRGIDGDRGRTFRAAVAFVRANAETIFEGLRNAFRELFGTSHDEAQAAEIFGRAAACVSVQERGCGEQHGYRVLANERPDHARIERVRMKHYTDARGGGKAERA